MKRLLLVFTLIASPCLAQSNTPLPIIIGPAQPIAGDGTVAGASQIKFPDGTSGAPSITFASEASLGFYRFSTGVVGYTGSLVDVGNHVVIMGATSTISFNGRSLASSPADGQINLSNNAVGAGIGLDVATDGTLKVRTRAQSADAALTGSTLTGSTSVIAPLFRSTVAKVLLQGTGTGPTQIASTQTTVPTCTTNCGTPGNVCVGSDSDMICTMGTTPASGVVVAFNGTWAAAPSCIVQMALAGMVVGKQVLTAATTTSQITLVTNGTAPVAGDKYAILCRGTQ